MCLPVSKWVGRFYNGPNFMSSCNKNTLRWPDNSTKSCTSASVSIEGSTRTTENNCYLAVYTQPYYL